LKPELFCIIIVQLAPSFYWLRLAQRLYIVGLVTARRQRWLHKSCRMTEIH
jgi:hypothetical protein